MLNKTIEILKDYMEEDIDIHADSLLDVDLGLTSLDVLNIVVAFEQEFDIEVPDQIIPDFHTVQDIVDYMEKHV